MGNDYKKFRPAYLKIHEDMERLSRAMNPSYLKIYEQMERALGPIRENHLAVTRSLELAGLTSSRLTEIAHANQHWHDLIDQATATSRIFGDITKTHQTWLDMIKPVQSSIDQLQIAAKLSMCDVAHGLTVSEKLFSGIDFGHLKLTKAFPDPIVPDLERVMQGITSTYENLANSINTLPEITSLPKFVLPGATREVFTTGYSIESICTIDDPDYEKDPDEVELINEIEQEASSCVALLENVNPSLVKPYRGARDALKSGNSDRTRHILSSLRELWNHLIRNLAPDELVLTWVPGDKKELLHEGKPTRRARILYVCRKLDNDPLSDFIVQDTKALVKLIEIFNRVHELEPELTDEQLRALLLRTDSWLMYLLKIWEETK